MATFFNLEELSVQGERGAGSLPPALALASALSRDSRHVYHDSPHLPARTEIPLRVSQQRENFSQMAFVLPLTAAILFLPALPILILSTSVRRRHVWEVQSWLKCRVPI
jgi:hypothetical protein